MAPGPHSGLDCSGGNGVVGAALDPMEEAKPDPAATKAAEAEAQRVRSSLSIKPRIAILGFSGAGKSSLFNAILGKNLSEEAAGGARGTTAARPEESRGFIFVDCPGYGAGSMKAPEIILKETMDPHVILQVISGASAIEDQDIALYKVLSRHVKTLVALSKVDILDADELSQVDAALVSRLGVPRNNLIHVSARTGHNVENLVRLIVGHLPTGAKEGFLGGLEGHYTVKGEESGRIVSYYAGGAALLGMAPIPMADFVSVYATLIAMTIHVGHIYGQGNISTQEAAKMAGGALGAGFAARMAARQVLKFVPFLGSAVGAAMAFASVQAYGRTLIWWFTNGMKLPREAMNEYFQKEFKRAEQEAKNLDLEKLKKERSAR